jgi:cell division protein FtsL
MNTAVKSLTTRTLSWWSFSFRITKSQMTIMILSFAVIMSAFSLVYMKDFNRRLTSQYETLQDSNVQLHNSWSQLMIQKSKLAGQRRVADLARQDLNMKVPAPKSVVMIHQ